MINRLLNLAGHVLRLLNFVWTCLFTLAMVALVISLPFWLLYKTISPLFGPNPLDYIREVSTGLGTIILLAVGVTATIVVSMKLFAKFSFVRSVAKGAAAVLTAIVVVVSLAHCFGGQPSCAPSRYVECP